MSPSECRDEPLAELVTLGCTAIARTAIGKVRPKIFHATRSLARAAMKEYMRATQGRILAICQTNRHEDASITNPTNGARLHPDIVFEG